MDFIEYVLSQNAQPPGVPQPSFQSIENFMIPAEVAIKNTTDSVLFYIHTEQFWSATK